MDTIEEDMCVVKDEEARDELMRSRSQQRGALNGRGVTIPAVSTRPPPQDAPSGSSGRPATSTFSANVLNEQTAQSIANAVLHQKGMRCGPDALRLLSFGIQQHLANIIDAATAFSRKRSNRTACEHFNKTQKLMSLDLPGSGVGEVAPENRLNLGMMWAPDVGTQLRSEIAAKEETYAKKYAEEEESLRSELVKIDEERKSAGRKRSKEDGPASSSTAGKDWWIKEVGKVGVLLVKISVTNFTQNKLISLPLWCLSQEADRQAGLLSWEELALSQMKLNVASKFKLGKFLAQTKKARALQQQQQSVEDTAPAGVLIDTYVILTSFSLWWFGILGNPGSHADPSRSSSSAPDSSAQGEGSNDWVRQPCPLALVQTASSSETAKIAYEITIADVVHAVSKAKGLHLSGEKFSADVGNAILSARNKHPIS